MPRNPDPEPSLLARWVLERNQRMEIESVDTQEAVRQIFGNPDISEPDSPSSGLVDQQAWFARIRLAHRPR